MRKTLGREEVIEVVGFLFEIALQNVCHEFVNRYETGGRSAALDILIKLVV